MRHDDRCRPATLARGIALLAIPTLLFAHDRLARPRPPSVYQAQTSATTVAYRGSVRWYIADLKPSFPEHKQYSSASALTEANYRTVLDGLVANAKVNGIRLPIFPLYPQAAQYPQLYVDVLGYARSIGLAIYASPMSVGMSDYQGWSDQRYAAWLADYASVFHPDFLSPFNEAGIGRGRLSAILTTLHGLLAGSSRLVGPDRQHVDKTIEDVSADPGLEAEFDILTSHNANQDHSATVDNWTRLVGLAGEARPVWSSENPGTWGEREGRHLPGIADAVEGGVQGIVVWMAKPGLVDDTGQVTPKGSTIASHLVAAP